MIQDVRQRFNAAFTQEKYQAFLNTVNTAFGEPCTFRMSETPIFVPKALKNKLLKGVEDIARVYGFHGAPVFVSSEGQHVKLDDLELGDDLHLDDLSENSNNI